MQTYIGQKFGKLTIVKIENFGRGFKVECLCECGNKKYEKLSIIQKAKSCGCGKNLSKEILEQELKNLSKQEIADKYGYSLEGLRQKIRLLKIECYKNFTLKHDYFKTQSSNMFYILGVIASDGNIHNKRPYINIELKRNDKSLLKFIANEINKNQTIYEYEHFNKRSKKTYKACKISFYSKTLKQDLKELGILPNKTKIGLNIDIDKIPEDFFYDFIRGHFDGDGSVYHKKKKLVTKITCSDITFLQKIQKRINLQSSIQSSKNKTYHDLIYCNKSSIILRERLYKNSEKSFFLTRKKEKYYAYKS
jgi:hypothetical protein